MNIVKSLLEKRNQSLWLLALLVAVWLFWSGIFKPLVIGLGALSCILTVLVVQRMNTLHNTEVTVKFNIRFFGYWLWLIKEIIKSSLQVVLIVLNPRMPISPRVFDIDAKNMSVGDQVLFGNSITLTPGTLTIDLFEGRLKVHSLTNEGADDLMSGEMARRILALRKAN